MSASPPEFARTRRTFREGHTFVGMTCVQCGLEDGRAGDRRGEVNPEFCPFIMHSGPALVTFRFRIGPVLDPFLDCFGPSLGSFWARSGPVSGQLWTRPGPRFWALGWFWARTGPGLVLVPLSARSGSFRGRFAPDHRTPSTYTTTHPPSHGNTHTHTQIFQQRKGHHSGCCS